VLTEAIERGGTTLRDFLRADGEPGYFQLELLAYEREGKPCKHCGARIKRVVVGQRSSYYCPRCQQ
jgi:formamidopyrimidine-DNA glycosylase